jgi:hypothetical protein
MKPWFTALAANSIRAVCAASLLSLLTARATAIPPARPETDGQALEQLRTSKAALDCGQSCAEAWRNDRSELTTHYSAGDWRELALLVMQTNHRQDLAYFYHGRAAEGLGESASASVYYKTAEALATGTDETAKCAASPEGCNGLNLLTEVLTRIQIVEAVSGRNAFAARRQQHSQPQAGQPADAPGQPPTGNWVDPPPASP